MMKDFLTVNDFSKDELLEIVSLSLAIDKAVIVGPRHIFMHNLT